MQDRLIQPGRSLGNRTGQMASCVIALVVAMLVTASCAPSPFDESWMPPRGLAIDAPTWQPPRLTEPHDAAEPDAALPKPNDAVEQLALGDAVTRAVLHSPELASYAYDVRVAEARQIQAGLSPNPRASYSAENLGGPNGGDLFVRQTLRISQVIELADKRNKRVQLATANQRLAAWDYENRRLDVITQVGQRFVAVVAAQQRVALAERTVALTRNVYDIVDERVKAGVIPPTERDRSAVRVSIERIALDRAKHQLLARRQALVATWGGAKPVFQSAAGNLDYSPVTTTMETLVAKASNHPRLARWADEIAQRERTVDLAKANGVPDLTAGAGLRHFPDSGDAAGVIELSVPLPLNDRNQGRVLEARYNVGKARAQQRKAEAKIREELAVAFADLNASRFAIVTINDEALPAASASLKAAKEAFQNGKTDFLDVLDAERTLVDVERTLIDAGESFHTAIATIEGLTATPIAHHAPVNKSE